MLEQVKGRVRIGSKRGMDHNGTVCMARTKYGFSRRLTGRTTHKVHRRHGQFHLSQRMGISPARERQKNLLGGQETAHPVNEQDKSLLFNEFGLPRLFSPRTRQLLIIGRNLLVFFSLALTTPSSCSRFKDSIHLQVGPHAMGPYCEAKHLPM